MKPAVLEKNRAVWIDGAGESLLQEARRTGQVTAEDLRANYTKPDHPNWVGACFNIARSEGLQRTGYRPSRDKTRAGGVIGVWAINTKH